MRGFSKAIIAGNLTRDPELRNTPSGAAVCSFSVAVNRTTGKDTSSVSFFDCTAWEKNAEVISQYAKKGTGILLSGRLEQRTWDDKTSGQKRSRVEIVVDEFNFIGGNDRQGETTTSASVVAEPEAVDEIPDEPIDLSDIPF